jgi:hypothetical protein
MKSQKQQKQLSLGLEDIDLNLSESNQNPFCPPDKVPVCVHYIFLYQGQQHLRVIPGKRLFNSTMVHEVVNRGDVFAVNLETGMLTILPGTFTPEPIYTLNIMHHEP